MLLSIGVFVVVAAAAAVRKKNFFLAYIIFAPMLCYYCLMGEKSINIIHTIFFLLLLSFSYAL
jgi:hypothetical protein